MQAVAVAGAVLGTVLALTLVALVPLTLAVAGGAAFGTAGSAAGLVLGGAALVMGYRSLLRRSAETGRPTAGDVARSTITGSVFVQEGPVGPGLAPETAQAWLDRHQRAARRTGAVANGAPLAGLLVGCGAGLLLAGPAAGLLLAVVGAALGLLGGFGFAVLRMRRPVRP